MTESTVHGTSSAYFNGCTAGPNGGACDACKAAGRSRRQEGTYAAFLAGATTKQPLFLPGDRTTPYDAADQRHGTLSAYTQGCLCPWCRLAGKAYRDHLKLGLKLPKGYNAQNQDTA